MHSTDKKWRPGPLLHRAVQSDWRLLIRVGAIVALTAVLLTAFFSYIFFELYGESELCRQRYDLPPLSFYVGRFSCFVALWELAAEVGYILALVAGPLLLAFLTTVWVNWPRQGSGPGGQHLARQDGGRAKPVDVVAQAQFLFWVLTASLGIALVAALTLWAAGLSSMSPDQAIGSVLFYAFHLYPAGLLTFGLVQLIVWLLRVVAGLRHSR